MSQPHAYLLTWTTYGTWLPGDERGSVDTEHNIYAEPFAAPRARRHASNAAKLAQPAFQLDSAARKVVHDTIVEACAFRRWDLVALHVRSNHVHVVVRSDQTPAATAANLKARATRVLRDRGVIGETRLVWTECGSGRYLWNEHSVLAAAKYVLEGQGAELE